MSEETFRWGFGVAGIVLGLAVIVWLILKVRPRRHTMSRWLYRGQFVLPAFVILQGISGLLPDDSDWTWPIIAAEAACIVLWVVLLVKAWPDLRDRSGRPGPG